MTYQDNGYVSRVGYTQQFALAGAAVDPRWDNLMAGWTLDESSDGSGQVDRADVLGTYTMTDVNTTASRAGNIGNGADFVLADNTHLTNTSGSDFAWLSGSGPKTVSLWKLNDSFSSLHFFVGNGSGVGSQQGGWYIYTVPGGAITFGISDVAGTWKNYSSSGTAPNTGEWYHLVCWYDSGTTWLAINDGSPENLGAAFTLASGAGSLLDLRLGYMPNGSFPLDGGLDEVYIFSDVKDAAWRTAMYNAGAGRQYPS
jgi:hypothetical protein